MDEDNRHLQRGLGFSSNGSPVEDITNMMARRLTRRSSSVRMSQGSVCSIQIQSPTSATTELMLLSLKTNHAKCHTENRVFHSFHKSDRSDISANVVGICLCVNIVLS